MLEYNDDDDGYRYRHHRHHHCHHHLAIYWPNPLLLIGF